MSARKDLNEAAREVFRRVPLAKTIAINLVDVWFQVWLLPFRRWRRHGSSTAERQALISNADAYNGAAEDYYVKFKNPSFLLNKPFSDPAGLSKHLMDAGILIAAGKIAPGDVVAEIGAGSCWLSHMLNRYGCPTISIDVSTTALGLGRQLFEKDPSTNWNLNPRFAVYDGHRLPLDTASCDRIVINDAFHHIPNQRALLTEMHRVLRSDGIVAMSEPGQGHGEAEHSLKESRDWGVLENELVVEDLAELARACGFAHVKVVIQSPLIETEIDAQQFGRFMGGKGFARYWNHLCYSLEQHHHLVFYKSRPVPTTRRPGTLRAHIDVTSSMPTAVTAERAIDVGLRIVNEGDTVWLGGYGPRGGWTRLGAHLEKDNEARESVDYDWWRASLPSDVAPGSSVKVDAQFPGIAQPGHYRIVIEPVIEGMIWFIERGSAPLVITIEVT